MKRYQVICGNCKAERTVDIHPSPMGERIDWLEDRFVTGVTNIVSARKRLDGQWGFQCTCGANDLMTNQEVDSFSNLQSPTPKEIDSVVANLKAEHPLFRLVAA